MAYTGFGKTRLAGYCEEPQAVLSIAKEESRKSRTFRARFLAEFILSGQGEILRFAQKDSEGLGMTGIAKFFRSLYSPVGYNTRIRTRSTSATRR